MDAPAERCGIEELEAAEFRQRLHELLQHTAAADQRATAWSFSCEVVPDRCVLGDRSWSVLRDGTTVAVGVVRDAVKGFVLAADAALRAGSADEVKGTSEQLLRDSLVLLLHAPMNYTLWARRRRALEQLLQQAIGDDSTEAWLQYELGVTALVLSLHPKVADAWTHRWIVAGRCRCSCGGGATTADGTQDAKRARLLTPEREWPLIAQSSDRHHRNYAAWEHCRRVARCGGDDEVRIERFLEGAEAHFARLVGDPSSMQFAISTLHDLAVGPSDAPWALPFCARWTRRLLRCNVSMLRAHAAHGHEGLWLTRRGLLHLALSLEAMGCPVLGSWCFADELALATVHADCPPSMEFGNPAADLVSLSQSGGSPRWHAYNAAKYGQWLLKCCCRSP